MPSPTPAHILLIDDNQDDIDLALLAFAGAKLKNPVSVCHCGDSAIKFLQDPKNTLPALILLDWKMPRMSGLELLKILKTDPTWRRIPVCILTTSDSPLDINSAYSGYANAYLEKPVDFHQLVDLITHSGRFWLQIVTLPLLGES